MIELVRRMLVLLVDLVGGSSSFGLDSNTLALHNNTKTTECNEHDYV